MKRDLLPRITNELARVTVPGMHIKVKGIRFNEEPIKFKSRKAKNKIYMRIILG